ncbi:MAG: hypothetical protein KC643_15505 [Nitrospira sp.]|nr:hypothetical protein [Nitrospira sp.]
MKYFYRSFGNDLKRLLPAGETMEITVPDRATRLLLVDYEPIRKGHSIVTLTDTTRRVEDFHDMPLKDIHFMGTRHRDDRPSFTSITFECFNEGDEILAEPVMFTDHAQNSYKHVFIYNEKGYRLESNMALQEKLLEDAGRKFEKFHSLGFFGIHAVRKIRDDLTITREFVDTTLKTEYNHSRAVEDRSRQTYKEEMNFFRQVENKRQQDQQ